MTTQPVEAGCARHPAAVSHDGLCPLCLLGAAIGPSTASPRESPPDVNRLRHPGQLTIQMPLGTGPTTSVFLAREQTPVGGLFRLKTWHGRAPAEFLPRFRQLQMALADWQEPGVKPPIAAWVDSAGYPWMLSDFQQGVPLLHRVKSGHLRAEAAIALLTPLIATIRRAHARGFAHAAIVPGNVIVAPGGLSTHLLDFGTRPLLNPIEHGRATDADLDGFVSLARAIREVPRGSQPGCGGALL